MIDLLNLNEEKRMVNFEIENLLFLRYPSPKWRRGKLPDRMMRSGSFYHTMDV